MANIINRQQTFSTNGTVTAAGLHNLIDTALVNSAIIKNQQEITTIGTADLLLIAPDSVDSSLAPRKVTVQNLVEDAFTFGTYLDLNLSGKVTASTATIGTAVISRSTISTATITLGTISNFTTTLAGDFTISSGTGTLGTSGVTLGTYGGTESVPIISVDSKGRVTTMSTVAAAAGAKGGGTDKIFWENDTTVTTSYTISTNKNAVSAGPITIGTGTVTVQDGSVWTVV
jgi:hypothetical protein